MTIEEKAEKEYPYVNSIDYPETCSYNKIKLQEMVLFMEPGGCLKKQPIGLVIMWSLISLEDQ